MHIRTLFIVFVVAAVGLAACNLPGAGVSTQEVISPIESPTATSEEILPIATRTPRPTARPSATPITDIPVNIIQIQGRDYRAFRLEGDTFQIVCMESCPVDDSLMIAQYDGFRRAKDRLVEYLQIDILPELTPFDVHITNDNVCGEFGSGGAHAARYADSGRGYACLFTYEDLSRFNLMTPGELRSITRQQLGLHEYFHAVLFNRHIASYEDYAQALTYYIAVFDGDYRDACSDDVHVLAPLVYNLCTRHGLTFEMIPASLAALDALFQSGAGEIVLNPGQAPVTSIAQYIQILNEMLGTDVTQTFIDSGWPP